MLDVRVCDPVCRNNLHVDAIDKAEKEKQRKYGPHCTASNMCFVPVVMESFGRWSEQTTALVKALVRRVFDRDPDFMAESGLMHYWVKRLSCVLQRTQAETILNRYNRVSFESNGSDCVMDECVVTSVMSDVVV